MRLPPSVLTSLAALALSSIDGPRRKGRRIRGKRSLARTAKKKRARRRMQKASRRRNRR